MENNCATIILNWNGSNDTIACIESMNKLQEARTDLVIVDNASSPEEYKILETQLGFNNGALDIYTKRVTNPVPNFIEPKNYLFSIPTDEIGLNPNLVQNPGWEL